MKLFDKIRDEESDEVVLRSNEEPAETEEDDGHLRNEVEERLTDVSSKTSSAASSSSSSKDSGSASGGSALPGMGSGSTESSSSSSSLKSTASSSVDIEDVHKQNKQIIKLLEEIKSEVGGSSNELL